MGVKPLTNWTKGQIDGVIIKNLKFHHDERGSLCETYRTDELPAGLTPVMSYASYTKPGVTRGPHEHLKQTDIFTFLGPGSFLLKLWDNRSGSPTYLNYTEIKAGLENPLTVIVPPGIVHGYKNISTTEAGMVLNYPDQLFMGPGKKEPVDEIRHEDNPSNPFQMG